MSANGWEIHKLGYLLGNKGYIRGPFGSSLKRGEMKSDGIPVYEQQHAIYNSRDFRFYIDEEKFTELRRFQVKTSDLIVSCSGTIGKVSIITEEDPKGIISQALLILRPDNTKVLPEFLKYYFLSREGFNNLVSTSHGSVQINIASRDIVESIILNVPDILTQHHIINILSSLDDKIELNNQINATLEAIAQAIFKEWFVDFNFPGTTGEMVESELGLIPKGWRVGKLGDVLSAIETGARPKGGVGYLSEGIPSIGAENIIGLGIYDYSKEKFISTEFFTKLKNGIVRSEDVLLYKDGASLGRKSMFMDDFPHKICAVNEHVFILRTNNLSNQMYLYFWLDQSFMTENIKNINSNSAQPGINQPGVNSLPILIPDKNIIHGYDQLVRPLLSRLFNNCKESMTLSEIRNVLLPKLMNGEIEL